MYICNVLSFVRQQIKRILDGGNASVWLVVLLGASSIIIFILSSFCEQWKQEDTGMRVRRCRPLCQDKHKDSPTFDSTNQVLSIRDHFLQMSCLFDSKAENQERSVGSHRRKCEHVFLPLPLPSMKINKETCVGRFNPKKHLSGAAFRRP